MEFTFRWPVMRLKDISNWANTEVRTISIKSDVCPDPFHVSVRRFVPIPQDSLYKGWMDGKTKKFKEVTPFAIVNMSAAAKDLAEHVNTYAFHCMDFFLKGRDTLLTETYAFARQYMIVAVSSRTVKIVSVEMLMTNFSLMRRGVCLATSFGYGLQFVVPRPRRKLLEKIPLVSNCQSPKLPGLHLLSYGSSREFHSP
jgi:hypothetical protein